MEDIFSLHELIIVYIELGIVCSWGKLSMQILQ